MKSKFQKELSETLIIVVLIMLFFMVLAVYALPVVIVGNSITGLLFDSETSTYVIRVLGVNQSEFQLISNTNECLINCEATIRLKLYTGIVLPSAGTPLFDLTYIKALPTMKGLKDLRIEIWNYTFENQTTRYESINTPYIVNTNGTILTVNNVTFVPVTAITQRENKLYNTLFAGVTLPAGNYLLKVKGTKFLDVNGSIINPNNVDWLPRISGYDLDRWAWWNTSWGRKVPLNFTGTGTGDYQVLVNLTYVSQMMTDFNDTRVLNASENQEIPFWIENYVLSGYANIWIKGNFTTTNETQAYIYYNNSGSASSSNINNTMEFGDEFNGLVIDVNKWTITTAGGTPNITTNGGATGMNLSTNGAGAGLSGVVAKSGFAAPSIIEWRGNTTVDLDTSNVRFKTRSTALADDEGVNGVGWINNGNTADSLRAITTSSSVNTVTATTYVDGIWHKWKYNYTSSAFTLVNDSIPVTTHTTNIPTGVTNMSFLTAGTFHKAFVDYVFVRKYNETDRFATVGAAQTVVALSEIRVNTTFRAINTTFGSAVNVSFQYQVIGGTPDQCTLSLNFVNTTLTNSSAKCQNSSFITNATGMTNGDFRISVNDTSNNVNESVANKYTVDAVPNEIRVTSPTNTTYGRSQNISITATLIRSDADFCQYTLDRGVNITLTNVTKCQNSTFLTNATGITFSNFTYYANDTSSNLNSSMTIGFAVDAEAPFLSINASLNRTFNATAFIDFNVRDIGNNLGACSYILDNGANTTIASCNNFTLTGLADGVHNITIRTNDTLSNVNQSATINLTVDLTGPTVSNVTVNQTYLGGVRTVNISASSVDSNNVSNVFVEILNPDNVLNITNRTLTLQFGQTYSFQYTSNTTNGNWTVIIYSNDTLSNNATGSRTSFVVDTINPTPTVTRTDSMAGVLRLINSTSVTINVNDTNVANWSLLVIYPNGTLRTTFNGTLNTTFGFNSTSSDPVGNWTANLSATDAAGNTRTVSDWFGLANYSVAYDFRFEVGNYTDVNSAWGNVTAITNNTSTDLDYLRVARFSFSGICQNCSASTQFNVTENFTGSFSIVEFRNSVNTSINYTVVGSNLVNVSYLANLSTEQNLTEEGRLRVRVPNSLLFILRPDVNGSLWYVVQPRNVTNNTHISMYARTATTTNNTFDATVNHVRYSSCLTDSNGTAVPPVCRILTTLVDINDANNGNNGQIDLFVDGPTLSKNIRRFRTNFTDFLYRETIEGGGMQTSGGIGGSGGGGGLPSLAAVVQEKCPPGFKLVNDTSLGKEVCKTEMLELPPIESSRAAMATIILITAGIGFIFSQQGKKRQAMQRRQKDELFG